LPTPILRFSFAYVEGSGLDSVRPTYEELEARLSIAEQSLRKYERLAVAGRYAGAVMHEVNNPLEAIGNLVFLTKNRPDDAHQVREHMQISESQLARLGEITRKSLAFYREEAEPKEFDLVAIAEAAIRLHLQGLPVGRVTLTKQFPQAVSVFGREGEILQVLSNLFLNALDALPEQDAKFRLRIRVVGKRVHVAIADNGQGIPAALRASLFKPMPPVKAREQGSDCGSQGKSWTDTVERSAFVALDGSATAGRSFC
jgi:C4-dicarboxylate-specific signal transduction histidine kinase